MTKTAILALDQGTTSSRAILFSQSGDILFSSQEEFEQIYPQDGWVEHDPEAIWDTTLRSAKAVLKYASENDFAVKTIGITNQRETTLIWDRKTGTPIYNAIVWQDRRTAQICRDLKARLSEAEISEKTGLLLDPYFSATKAAWILDNVDGARARAEAGELAFGTVDSFLIWRLTGGAVHATDATNASRTNLFNIMTQDWDDGLCEIFNVPQAILPEVKDCADDYGVADVGVLGTAIPISGVAGDQQAAAIGQCCFDKGDIKSTYGTGCFVILNTGSERVRSDNRLLSTVGYRLGGKTSYALEGSIFMAGASVQWLRDSMGLINDARETEAIVRDMESNDGVYLVPAFTGLGAPHWDPDARAAIFGMTRDTQPKHFVRATLESVVYQTYDLFKAMADDGTTPKALRVDGGMAANDWVCQFLADILGIPVERPKIMETTALGAAFLAGLHSGIYKDLDDLRATWSATAEFTPNLDAKAREGLLSGWQSAIEKVTG